MEQNYYEFSNIVTDRTREEYFGKPSFETSPQIEKKEEPVKTSIKPISRNFKERDIKKEEHILPSFEPAVKVVQMKPDIQEETRQEVEKPVIKKVFEPELETYTRKATPNKSAGVISSDFNTQPKVDQPQRKTIEPERVTYRYPDVSMFSKKERNLDEQPQWLLDQIDVINATLQQFGIEG